jgi:hypothetical protein
MRHLIALTAVAVTSAAAALPAHGGLAVPSPSLDGTTPPPPALHASGRISTGDSRGNSTAAHRPTFAATTDRHTFGWRDAAIRTAAGALLALLGASAVLMVRRHSGDRPLPYELFKSDRGRGDEHRSATV